MPRTNDHSLQQAIAQFMEQARLAEPALQRRVVSQWAQIVGAPIAEQTENIWFDRGVAFVKIKSPAWRAELGFARGRLVERINEHAGRALVADVRIV